MSLNYDIESTEPNPKWYKFRQRLSNWLLFLAKKAYPENPKVRAFFLKQMTDAMIYGGSIQHVDYSDFYKAPAE